MSTTNVYASGDGRVYRGLTAPWSQANWDTVHDAATGTGADMNLGCYTSVTFRATGTGYLQRAHTPFDTSAVPDTDTVSAASIYIQAVSGQVNNDFSENLYVVPSTQADTSGPATGDYNKSGDTNNPTVLGTKAIADVSTVAYTEVPLNATGIAAINKTGFSKFAWRVQHDADDTYYDASGGVKNSQVYFYTSSQAAGTSQDPYISITHASGGSSSIKTMNGLAKASVKTVNGLAIASVKTWNGLA